MGPTAGGGGAAAPSVVAPLVARSWALSEVIYLPFDLDPNFSRAQFDKALEKYRIEDFALASFRKHRRGSRLGGAHFPVETLIKFSATPLKKPLLSSVPTRLKRIGAQLFDCLLQYTGLKPAANSMEIIVRWVISALEQHDPVLRDEVFFQLIKQTRNCQNGSTLKRTWQMFLIIATIFPCSQEVYMWILAHLAKGTASSDQQLSAIATFCYFRFQARHYLGVPLDLKTVAPHYIDQIGGHIVKGKAQFGALLYEVMWNQQPKFPRLPIPYVLHYLIGLLKERNAFRTEGIFRIPGNADLVNDIQTQMNDDVTALARGDVNVLATILKNWLKALPNPLVPIEMIGLFRSECEQAKYLGFIEKLPQVHLLTLTYVVGFLREVIANAQYTGMGRSDLATIFGPCFINPQRSARNDPVHIQQLTEYAVAFTNRLLEMRDASIIYPLNPAYIPAPGALKKPTQARPAPPAKPAAKGSKPSKKPAPARASAPGDARDDNPFLGDGQ